MMENWGHEEEKMTEMTLSQLNELVHNYATLRNKKDELEEQASEIEKQIQKIEPKLLEYLTTYCNPGDGKAPSFRSTAGLISIRTTRSVSLPSDPEKRNEFFDYLKKEKLFDNMISVNSRTLSSWTSKEIEAKEKEGKFGWVPPGLSAPTEMKKVVLKRGGDV